MPCCPATSPRPLTARRARRASAAHRANGARRLGAGAAAIAAAASMPLAAPAAHAAPATGAVSASTTSAVASSAYWLATSGGESAAFGVSATPSATTPPVNGPVVSVASLPAGGGYWLAGSNGAVAAYGSARYFGSMAGTHLNQPIVGIASTSDGGGYWLVASDGGIFSFGDARFFGSTGAIRLNQPIVGMSSTSDGGGYWLVASDGGIFSFGDAHFFGSTGAIRLNQPVVGMAAVGSQGYWLVARDGGIFSFGAARFYGSTGAIRLNQPMVGMASTSDNGGYWLVAADGGIFTYGDAPFRGSATGTVPYGQHVVGLSPTPGVGTGVMGTGFPIPAVYSSGATGYDISWPQCGGAYPPYSNVAVVGVNNGYSFSTNPCLRSEAAWAGKSLSLYINLNSPAGSNSSQWASGPAGNCALGDLSCESYNYGYNNAVASVRTADATGAAAGSYWLDVETTNYWTSDTAANARVVAGAIAGVRALGRAPAIYATSYQWGIIAGAYRPGVPVWYPTGVATSHPSYWCSGSSFTGSSVRLVQVMAGNYDGDYSC